MACSQPEVSPQAEEVADEPALVSPRAEELAERAVASPQAEKVADEPAPVSLRAEELAERAVAFPSAAEDDSAVASRPALAAVRASAVRWAGDCPPRPAWR